MKSCRVRPQDTFLDYHSSLAAMEQSRAASLKRLSSNNNSNALSSSTAAGPLRIKIISIGGSGVGKSCLIKRFCEDRFVSKYIATIGVDYGVKPVKVDGADVRVNFWDLSGLAEFFEIRNEFYKDAQGGLLVYDVSMRESFEALDMWLAEAAKFGANYRDFPIALCANKTDKKARTVTEEEGRKYAAARGLNYYETSAQTGQNVSSMFDFLFKAAVNRLNSSA